MRHTTICKVSYRNAEIYVSPATQTRNEGLYYSVCSPRTAQINAIQSVSTLIDFHHRVGLYDNGLGPIRTTQRY